MSNELQAEIGNWQYRSLSSYTSGTLDGTKNYYIYARCRKSSTGTSVFSASTNPLSYDDGTYYNLLVGILDKEQFGSRSWCPMYGFTEISPGRIRVNKIISSDGNTYFDLANSEIGGKINFKDGIISNSVLSGEVCVKGKKNISDLTQTVMAGIAGGLLDVCFWAGVDSEHKTKAPFRVSKDGSVYMEKAVIRGTSSIEGFLYNKTILINSENIKEYCDYDGYTYNPIFDKIGGNIIFDSSVDPLGISFAGDKTFPSFNIYTQGSDITEYFKYVGKTYFIQNNTNGVIGITGPLLSKGYPYTTPSSPTRGIPVGHTLVFKCFLSPEYLTDKEGYTGRYVIGWGLVAAFDSLGHEYTLAYPGNWCGIDSIAPRKS